MIQRLGLIDRFPSPVQVFTDDLHKSQNIKTETSPVRSCRLVARLRAYRKPVQSAIKDAVIEYATASSILSAGNLTFSTRPSNLSPPCPKNRAVQPDSHFRSQFHHQVGRFEHQIFQGNLRATN